jgi:hypothetical protein
MKVGIAAAGMVVVLLGVVAAATMRSDSGTNPAVTVAGQAPASSLPATQPATIPAQPTVQDVQAVIAGLMANMTPPAGTGAPVLTKEQVEAQMREQLRLLGIPS